jgi:hypothetical protein
MNKTYEVLMRTVNSWSLGQTWELVPVSQRF